MKTYWQEVEPILGDRSRPDNNGICILGGGFAGVSTAYFLLQKGFDNITIVDAGEKNASYYRNAGHLLVGNGESPYRNLQTHGPEKAGKILHMASSFCQQMEETITELNIDCDYVKGNHLYVAASEAEADELDKSKDMIACSLIDTARYGFRSFGTDVGLRCEQSASAHPVKFRNALLEYVMKKGVKYHSYRAKSIRSAPGCAWVDGNNYDVVVICSNAYAQQHSTYFRDRQLIDPFKGQIIVSEPIKNLPEFYKRLSFNADHGFMYGQFTADNRLLIGGWRNNVTGGEIGSYNLDTNPEVDAGLQNWVREHMTDIDPVWEYSWAGIMGSSSTGLPFVGATREDNVWCCAGFTGYGFAWAHGSASVLADAMAGETLPTGWELLDPRK